MESRDIFDLTKYLNENFLMHVGVATLSYHIRIFLLIHYKELSISPYAELMSVTNVLQFCYIALEVYLLSWIFNVVGVMNSDFHSWIFIYLLFTSRVMFLPSKILMCDALGLGDLDISAP